jgi:hypothetical protein
MNIGTCKVCGKKTEYKYKSWIKECCSHKCSNTLKWFWARIPPLLKWWDELPSVLRYNQSIERKD